MIAARSIRIAVGQAPHRGSPSIPVSSLTDNFDDNSLDPKWTFGQIVSGGWTTTGCTVAETNQRIEATLAASASSRADGIVSVGTYDLTGDAFFVKIPNLASLQSTEAVRLSVGVGFNFTAQLAGGLISPEANGAPANASYGTDVWFRLRHDVPTNTLKIDTAPATASDPPAGGDWVNRLSWTRDPTTVLSGQVGISVDANPTSPSSPTTIQFDGFNTATTLGIAGSTSLAFAPAATLLGQGAVAGSSTLTFAPSATLLGSGAVSGSATITFAPAGTLLGSGAIVGSSTLVFAPSATLLGSGAVTGSSALTFAPAATLLGKGAVAGTASLTFAPSATLAGAGAVSGTSSLVFAPSGTVLGSGAITGQTALVFAPAATLSGTGRVIGSAALAFTLSGALLPPAGALAGSAAIVFGLTGRLFNRTFLQFGSLPSSVVLNPSTAPSPAGLVADPPPGMAVLTAMLEPNSAALVADPSPPLVELQGE